MLVQRDASGMNASTYQATALSIEQSDGGLIVAISEPAETRGRQRNCHLQAREFVLS